MISLRIAAGESSRLPLAWSAAAFVIFLGSDAPARATPPAAAGRTITQDSIRGHDLIEAAVRRIGGADRLRALTTLHYSLDGDAFNGLQGFDPVDLQSAARSGSLSVTSDSDYASHRHRRGVSQILAGGIRLDSVTCFQDGRITDAYPGTGRMSQSSGPESSVVDQMGRDNPVIFARRALENISTATFVERRTEAGALFDVVEVSWNPSVRMRVLLDANDHRISSLEAVTNDPLIGDDVVVYAFDGERVVEGLSFPERVALRRRNQLYYSARVADVAVNRPLAASLFDAPPFRPLDGEKATHALGNGAYEITGLDGGTFRVLFFDLGDGVAVFDAPASRARSKWVVEEIRKVLGDKPVKYLVLSHFHDDHVRGVGYYVDLGVQIVTTRETAPIVARYATVQSRLNPDLPSEGRRPSFLLVDGDEHTGQRKGRLELAGSPGRILTIYTLPDCPHARDMLVAYQPEGRLIVQADLFVELAPYSPTSAAFAAWMASPSAPKIDWIVGTHLERISRETFEAAGASSVQKS